MGDGMGDGMGDVRQVSVQAAYLSYEFELLALARTAAVHEVVLLAIQVAPSHYRRICRVDVLRDCVV